MGLQPVPFLSPTRREQTQLAWRGWSHLVLPPPRTPGVRQPPLPGMVGSAHPPQPAGELNQAYPSHTWATVAGLSVVPQDRQPGNGCRHGVFKPSYQIRSCSFIHHYSDSGISLRELEELCAGLRGLRGGVAARKWGSGRGGKETVVRGLGAGSWELGEHSQHAPAFCLRWGPPASSLASSRSLLEMQNQSLPQSS